GAGGSLSNCGGLRASFFSIRDEFFGYIPQQCSKKGQDASDIGQGYSGIGGSPFIRRVRLFLLCFLGGILSEFIGWDYFHKTRRLIGATLIFLGIAISLAALTLFIFNSSWYL